MNSKSKIQEEAHSQILRHLHENPAPSQRELGEQLRISLCAVNYRRKALMDRRLVKIRNFKRSTNKNGYAYFLTPTRVAEKALLIGRFLKRKMKKHEALLMKIGDLERERYAAAQNNIETLKSQHK